MSGNDKPDFSAALTLGRTLDLRLPDSGAVGDAHDQAQAESPPWLFNHMMRSWIYGPSRSNVARLPRMPSWLP
jgi:hypothetical protein